MKSLNIHMAPTISLASQVEILWFQRSSSNLTEVSKVTSYFIKKTMVSYLQNSGIKICIHFKKRYNGPPVR